MPSLHEAMSGLDATIRARTVEDGSPGLAVYRHAYRARLEAALATHYPVLASVLGRDKFRSLAGAYATQFPSRHWSIRWHGEHLDALLPPGPLAELARMEWALGAAFDAADEESVEQDALMRVPPDRWGSLAFALHPSVRVLFLDWTVERLWTSARERPEGPFEEPEPQRHGLIAWRAELDAKWRSATEGEAQALLMLDERGSLDAMGAHLGRDDARAVGAWLAGWLRHGLLVSPERRR